MGMGMDTGMKWGINQVITRLGWASLNKELVMRLGPSLFLYDRHACFLRPTRPRDGAQTSKHAAFSLR